MGGLHGISLKNQQDMKAQAMNSTMVPETFEIVVNASLKKLFEVPYLYTDVRKSFPEDL